MKQKITGKGEGEEFMKAGGNQALCGCPETSNDAIPF